MIIIMSCHKFLIKLDYNVWLYYIYLHFYISLLDSFTKQASLLTTIIVTTFMISQYKLTLWAWTVF